MVDMLNKHIFKMITRAPCLNPDIKRRSSLALLSVGLVEYGKFKSVCKKHDLDGFLDARRKIPNYTDVRYLHVEPFLELLREALVCPLCRASKKTKHQGSPLHLIVSTLEGRAKRPYFRQQSYPS